MLGATATRLLTNPDTGLIAPQLQIIVDALTAMHRPNSGLTWIRQAHVQSVLLELARQPTLTHEVLDRLPTGRTTNYIGPDYHTRRINTERRMRNHIAQSPPWASGSPSNPPPDRNTHRYK